MQLKLQPSPLDGSLNRFQAMKRGVAKQRINTMSKQWFDVDKSGLSKQAEEHGKGRLIGELVQNAWTKPASRRSPSPGPVPAVPWPT